MAKNLPYGSPSLGSPQELVMSGGSRTSKNRLMLLFTRTGLPTSEVEQVIEGGIHIAGGSSQISDCAAVGTGTIIERLQRARFESGELDHG